MKIKLNSFKHEINCLYAYYILKITAISALEQKDYVNAINNFQKMLNLYELRKQLFTPKENEHNEMLYFKEFLNVYYNLSSSYLVNYELIEILLNFLYIL